MGVTLRLGMGVRDLLAPGEGEGAHPFFFVNSTNHSEADLHFLVTFHPI